MKTILIAHNQKDLLIRWLDEISESPVDLNNIVIVDNHSEDGLGEVLKNTSFKYILCDDKVESYSIIVNTVIKEFQMSGQVYVTSPQYIPSYENMMHMESILENSDNILAVSPAEFIYEDNPERVDLIANDMNSFFESTNLNPLCTMYKVDLLSQMGGFDEELLFSDMAVKDLIFRDVLREIMSVQSERAVFLMHQQDLETSWERKLQNKDREVLKAKWNMNYFLFTK